MLEGRGKHERNTEETKGPWRCRNKFKDHRPKKQMLEYLISGTLFVCIDLELKRETSIVTVFNY